MGNQILQANLIDWNEGVVEEAVIRSMSDRQLRNFVLCMPTVLRMLGTDPQLRGNLRPNSDDY